MTDESPYLLVRAGSLYLAVMLTVAIWVWRRPTRRMTVGAVLASLWNLPALLALHLAAMHFEWWRFDARGGLLLGMPVDLYLSWAWLWGALPALAFPAAPLGVVLLAALAADLMLMPAAGPVVSVGPSWLVGEFAGLVACLLPGQLLARWTARDEYLPQRAVLQVIAFAGLLVLVLPAIVIEGSGARWSNPFERPAWQISLLVQILAVPALLGLSAVQEFVTRGAGTPVPFDSPRHLVTTGLYAYVANPMQLSAVLLLLLLGVILQNAWLSAAGVMAHLYSLGLAGWDEAEDLRERFGDTWAAYRHGVRRWIPRFRPWHQPGAPPARLFVHEDCGMCRDVGEWFRLRGARHLAIVAAGTHPSRALTRITYEAGDGTYAASGIAAVARALEHAHIGWALVGCALRLPVLSQALQLLVDASGGEPRRIVGRKLSN